MFLGRLKGRADLSGRKMVNLSGGCRFKEEGVKSEAGLEHSLHKALHIQSGF